jgi:hypothetical protein
VGSIPASRTNDHFPYQCLISDKVVILSSRRHQASILLLSIALHLLAYLAWPKGGHPLAAVEERNPVAIFFVEQPAVRALPKIPSRPDHSRSIDRPGIKAPERQADQPVQAAISLIEPAAPEPAPVQDLVGLAKRSAGGIDRELRQSRPAQPHKEPVFQSSKLEQAISAAYVDRSPPKQEELVLDDGRRVTRIGDHCYVMDSPLNTRGRDQIQKGSPVMARKCWQVGLAKK